MQIVGKIIKRTAAIGYKRDLRRGVAFEYQIDTLEKLLNFAKSTNFGIKYHFKQMLRKTTFVNEFQRRVPILDYDEFYEAWLKDTISGVAENTWPGVIDHYALSSGSTGAASKRLPVTKKFIRSFQRASIRQISTLHKLDLPALFFQKSILVVGGSSNLVTIENHVEGDLSGILKKYTAKIVTPFTLPSKEISAIKDWEEKLKEMVEAAPTWDVGVVAGVPSWCVMLIERIVKQHNLNSIHDIWPNFRVYVHGGIFLQPYLNRFESLFAQKVHCLNTYLASEGYFAYQKNPELEGMQLILNSGIFFEFIPFDSNHFDANGKLKNKKTALTINDVQAGIDYALVITTNAGLWRYLIGDLVQFTSVIKREVKITGRITQYLSHCGEHLSLDNINEALRNTAKDFSIALEEFCVLTNAENSSHEWFIGCDTEIDEVKFLEKLDTELSRLNDDYRAVRKMTLKAPIIKVISSITFYNYMREIGKVGSQNKFPRVMNKSQADSWKNFLKA